MIENSLLMTTMNTHPKNTTTFTLFPHLVPELRIKIWIHACFPRTVTVRYIPSLDKCISSSPFPLILQVSHEAREEALCIYNLTFETRSNPAEIYLNPYRDTLYLPRHMAMGYDETLRDFRSMIVDKGLLDEITRVAIDHVDVGVKRPWESYNKASLLRGFRKLEEVILVLCQKEKEGTKEGKDIRFVASEEKIEEVVRIWIDFRKAFLLEERNLAEISRQDGRDYEEFVLPAVRIRDKVVE